MNRKIQCLIMATLAVGFTACGGDESDDGPAFDPKLSVIQTELFNNSCAVSGCHDSTKAGSLDLTAGKSFASLVNVASEKSTMLRVKESASAESFLVKKLDGPSGSEGEKMPVGRPAITSGELEAIKQWIDAGAANN